MTEPTAPDELALEDAYNDVLTKSGRNLVCFQKAEQILKEIAKLIGMTISMDNVAESLANEQKRVDKMTLGSLSTRFTDIYLLGKEPEPPGTPERLGKGVILLTVSIENDPESLAKRRKSLDLLVNERNWLVHHLLDDFDRECVRACREMAERLDRQREAILPEIQKLRSDCLHIFECCRVHSEELSKPDNRARLRAYLNSQHPLIDQLEDIARGHQEGDGWIALGAAAARLTDFPHKEITRILQDRGAKSLEDMLIASERFDVKREPVGTKRHRVVYRLRSHDEPPD